MSEMSEIWRVKGGELSRKCRKYGIWVTGCTKYFECKKCWGRKRVKKEEIKPIKRRLK